MGVQWPQCKRPRRRHKGRIGGGLVCSSAQGPAGKPFSTAQALAPAYPSSTPAPPAQAPPQQATGLASLDFELPQQGRLYSLVATRGETEVTARAISGETLDRFVRLALAVGAVVVVLFLVRLVRRAKTPRLETVPITVLWICLGTLSIATGVFPVLGLALVGAGLALAIRRASRGAA